MFSNGGQMAKSRHIQTRIADADLAKAASFFLEQGCELNTVAAVVNMCIRGFSMAYPRELTDTEVDAIMVRFFGRNNKPEVHVIGEYVKQAAIQIEQQQQRMESIKEKATQAAQQLQRMEAIKAKAIAQLSTQAETQVADEEGLKQFMQAKTTDSDTIFTSFEDLFPNPNKENPNVQE